MKFDEIKTKTPDELKALLLDLRKEQLNMRFQHSGGQLSSTARMREVRRTIARVKTAMTAAQAQKSA